MRASSSGKMENVIFPIIGISDKAAPTNNIFRMPNLFFEKGRNAMAAIVQAKTIKTMKTRYLFAAFIVLTLAVGEPSLGQPNRKDGRNRSAGKAALLSRGEIAFVQQNIQRSGFLIFLEIEVYGMHPGRIFVFHEF